MAALVQQSSAFSSQPYGWYQGYPGATHLASGYGSSVPLVTITTVTHNPAVKKGLFRRKKAAVVTAPHTTVTPGPGAITTTSPFVPAAIGAPISTTTSTGPIAVNGPISQGLATPVQGFAAAPIGVQQPIHAASFQPLTAVQQQPIAAGGFAAPIATQAAGVSYQESLYQAPAQKLQQEAFVQPMMQPHAMQPLQQQAFEPLQQQAVQPLQQQAQGFQGAATNLPSAREAGNWNQLGEYGWYKQSQQIGRSETLWSQPQAESRSMQQAPLRTESFEQTNIAQPMVAQQQAFGQPLQQQAVQPLQQQAVQPLQQQAVQPLQQGTAMESRNLNQQYGWYDQTGQQTGMAKSFEQQGASTAIQQPMGQASSELGRAATTASQTIGNVESSLSRTSQFLPTAAPVGTGAR